MALLAVACLAVEYMIALGRIIYVPVLAAVALVEPVVLAGAQDLAAFASFVLVLQAVAAVALLALALTVRPRLATSTA